MRLVPKTIAKRARRVLLAGLMLFCVWFIFSGYLIGFFQIFQRPLSAIGTSITNAFYWFARAREITPQELEKLYDQRERYAVDHVEYERLIQENDLLSKELSFVRRNKYESVSASIISRSSASQMEKFVIDKGSEDGIKTGNAVMVSNGLYLGKVSAMTPHTATVTALTDPASTTAVSLLNQSRTIGIVQGGIGNLVKIAFIPLDEKVQESDLVVTSGLEEGVPGGLLIGLVNVVISNEQSPFQEAILEPFADHRRFHHVVVLIQIDRTSL